MYTVSHELLFHGAETEFALPICKAYSALKIWAYKMVRRVLWDESTYGKSNALLYSSMHQKIGTQRIRPGNKSQTKNSFILTTKHHSNSFAAWAASNKKASLRRGHSCLAESPKITLGLSQAPSKSVLPGATNHCSGTMSWASVNRWGATVLGITCFSWVLLISLSPSHYGYY